MLGLPHPDVCALDSENDDFPFLYTRPQRVESCFSPSSGVHERVSGVEMLMRCVWSIMCPLQVVTYVYELRDGEVNVSKSEFIKQK
jgi:hypothetical protein